MQPSRAWSRREVWIRKLLYPGHELLPVTPMAGRLLLAYSAMLAIGAGTPSS